MRGSVKILAFILAAAMAAVPVCGYQQYSSAIVLECDAEIDGMKFNYLINNNKTKFMLVEVYADVEELTVPESIDGVPVWGFRTIFLKSQK